MWYHYNEPNNTNYYTTTVANQGVDPKTPGLTDTFSGKAWGASVVGEGLSTGSDTTGLTLSGTSLEGVDVKITLLTLEPPESTTPTAWLDAIGRVSPGPPPSPSDPVSCDDCPTTWDEVMSRSYIEVTAAEPQWTLQAKQITDHVNWDRYLNLIQGRTSNSIHFYSF